MSIAVEAANEAKVLAQRSRRAVTIEDWEAPSTPGEEDDDGSSDEDTTHSHSGHEKTMHPTTFALVELCNCSTYTLTLKDYVCSHGQLFNEIQDKVLHQKKAHWTCGQRGKLKGNIGCAVFAIDDDTDDVHVELLLMWSVPFVGEDTACVAIGTQGQFTFMQSPKNNHANQQRELRKLMKQHTTHIQAVNTVHRATLGDIQIMSSFGRAPLTFWVVHRNHLDSISGQLYIPRDVDQLKKRKRNLTCRLVNGTDYYLEIIKCVYGKMEGECIKAIDPVVPPGDHSLWTSSATRLMRGNCGCVIYSVGGIAELLIQWYVPNVGACVVDCILSHTGAFSKISEHRLQEQVEEGPAIKSNVADFNLYKGLRVTHEFQDKAAGVVAGSHHHRTALFTLASTEEAAGTAVELPNDFPTIHVDADADADAGVDYDSLIAEATTDAQRATYAKMQSKMKVRLEPEPEPELEPEPDEMVEADLDAMHCHHPSRVVLYDYQRLSLKLRLPNVTATILERSERSSMRHALRKVQLGIDDINLDLTQSEFTTKAQGAVRSLKIADTFYSGDDMYLVSSRAFGSDENFIHVQVAIDTHTPTQYVTTIRAKTSSLIISYTNSTLYFVMGLSRELRRFHSPVESGRSRFQTEVPSLRPGGVGQVSLSSGGSPQLEGGLVVEPPSGGAGGAIIDLELLTAPVTITVCSSKLIPLVQLMLNSVDLSYLSCGDKAHGCTTIDLGVYYHNMELSAWEPMLEWATFKLDQQVNGRKTMASLISDDTINFNITTELVVDLVSLYVDAEIELDDDPDNDATYDSMLYVYNRCGVPISFNIMNGGSRSQQETRGPSTHNVHPSDPDHEGWIKVWDTFIEDELAVAVPRENMHLVKPQTFDPSVLGRRGELSANYVLIRVDVIHKSSEVGDTRPTEWRPLRPQSLSTCGSFLHYLEATDHDREASGDNGKHESKIVKRPFISTIVDRENGAHKITAESPVLVSNDTPVDLRMQLTDDAGFEKEEMHLSRQRSHIPVPLHLVDRQLRFQKMKTAGYSRPVARTVSSSLVHVAEEVGNDAEWMWTEYIRPGDSIRDSVVLMSPDESLAYCLYMDASRGPGTCHVVLHCPLNFENLLPCAMWVTLSQHETNKHSKSKAHNIMYQKFRLEKGARYKPPYVDVRFAMAISIELEDMPGVSFGGLEELNQKDPAVVWPKSTADDTLTLLDQKKRKMSVHLDYDHQSGKPTVVSMFVTHWIINETGLKLKYFDLSSGSTIKPPNYENRDDRHNDDSQQSPVPFMFSVKRGVSAKLGMGLTPHKYDDKPVALNHAELCTTVEVKDPKEKDARKRHRILCYVTNSDGRFCRTKLVYLRHLLHFKNQTPYSIAIMATMGDLPTVIVPGGGSRSFSWPKDDSLPKQLKLFYDTNKTFDDGNLDLALAQARWTSEFTVCDQDGNMQIEEFWLKVAISDDKDKVSYRALRVEVTIERETSRAIVVLTEEMQHPYKIESHLDLKIGYCQQGTHGTDHENWQELMPHHFSAFLWDVPLMEKKLEVIVIGRPQDKHIFEIDAVGAQNTEKNEGCVAEVVIEGHTRVLKIHKPGSHLSAHTVMDIPENQVVELRLHSVGFSVIDNIGSTPTELLYSFFDAIHYHSGCSSKESVVEFKLSDWQIADQTSQDTSASVVFGRAHSRVDNASDLAVQLGLRVSDTMSTDGAADPETISGTRDHFHLSVVRDLHNSSEICDVYRSLGIAIRPSAIKITDDFIARLHGHITSMQDKLTDDFPKLFQSNEIAEHTGAPKSPVAASVAAPVDPSTTCVKKVYFRELEIHPIMLEITVKFDGIEVGERLLPDWAQSLGVVFGNIDKAPLSFVAVKRTNHFEESSQFMEAIEYSYWMQTLKGSYRVLGAADFLGNPISLFGNLCDGVGDFFYMPACGLIISPTDMLEGFAKGTESLVAHSLTGVLESIGSVTDASAKGLDLLASDATHSAEIKGLRSQHAEGLEAGLKVGSEALARGMMSGLAGIVLQPVAGVKKHGLPGLLLGIERGLVGAVTKPASGTLAIVSEVSGGVAHSRCLGFRAGDEVQRVRIPRPFSHGRLIAPYSHAWAAECEQTFAPPTAALCITVYNVIFPDVVPGAVLWPGPLCAKISIGQGTTAATATTAERGHAAYVDDNDGTAAWGGSRGHAFAPISVELEDHALPPPFEVLSITITSSSHDTNGESVKGDAGFPIAQFDILLSGLGLEDRWRLEAQKHRAQSIRIVHDMATGLDNEDEEDADARLSQMVRLRKQTSWERVGLHTTRALERRSSGEGIEDADTPSPIAENKDSFNYGGLDASVASTADHGPRPKVGEGCWIDVGLSLLASDDAGQHSASRKSPLSFDFEEPIQL